MDLKNMNKERHQKSRVGEVVSNSMDKTVTVAVERLIIHPRFKKYYKRKNKFKAHDESNQCNVGDLVEMVETRPLSKTKRWVVKKIIKRAPSYE